MFLLRDTCNVPVLTKDVFFVLCVMCVRDSVLTYDVYKRDTLA